MKFNPFEWSEITNAENFKIPRGRVRVMLTKAAPLFLSQQGVEALVGVNTSFDLEVSEESWLRVPAQEGLQVFIAFRLQGFYSPRDAGDETFTNADRMVQESGSVLEVKRALRELEINKRAALREIRAASAQQRRDDERVIEPEPERDPEPEREP